MANEEQLAILRQGVVVWNKWRKENPKIWIDLTKAYLIETNLLGADFHGAEFTQASLRKSYLGGTDLIGADLGGADLSGADLSYADLIGTRLWEADLSLADLSFADFSLADLKGANLQGSIFSGASVEGANLGDVDLSKVIGLDAILHSGPSTIGTNTFAKSRGKIPEVFLRGCGLTDWEIEVVKLYNPDLSNAEINDIQYKMYDLRATQALQISPLFISYNHTDSEFVNKIESYLNKKGVRFWRDIHDMKAGKLEKQIDRAITQNRTVLLVLSEHSLKSDWVEHEVRTARGLEKDMGRDVLCPVALDDSWKSSRWPARVMEQIKEYNILDFSAWKDDVKFEGMFRKLIDGLELFYKG